MKKVISLVLSVMMMLTMFAGCRASGTAEIAAPTAAPTSATTAETAADTTPAAQEFNVAIVQQLDHTSLDEIRTAIVARLQAQAEEKGVKVNIQEFNGQNDATVLNQIGAQVVGDGVDLIIPIATLAAQCMVTAADGTDIPIVYAAISDPEAAGLTGLSNVTGTSDALNTAFILDMMLAANPDIKTVGLLYSNSEANSTTPIAEAKAYLKEKQIDFVEKTGNTSGEIVEAAASMVGRVDAVFTPTDNVVMAAEVTVAETLNEAGIPPLHRRGFLRGRRRLRHLRRQLHRAGHLHRRHGHGHPAGRRGSRIPRNGRRHHHRQHRNRRHPGHRLQRLRLHGQHRGRGQDRRIN